jgi:cytoskeletal protein CcmA (bactofilin family)
MAIAARPIPPASRETVIGPDAVMNGSVQLEHGLRVYGALRGECLRTRGSLVVEPSGDVQCGLMQVTEAHIRGDVTGTLAASKQVKLFAGGRFRGVIRTPHLLLEEGAQMIPDASTEDLALTERPGAAEAADSGGSE